MRQEWNRWTGANPVFSWATWLSARYDGVDLGGTGAEVTPAPGGGRLVVLRASLLEVADPGNAAARRTIGELAARLP